MLKRVAVFLFCLLMVFVATFGFVVGVVSVPTIYSYADVVDDDHLWEPLKQQSDLVKCFQSYCKSRDLTIEGSLADGVTTFTTGAFNVACNTLGFNMTQLQAEIKAEYDKSGKPFKFLMNASGVMAMNRIFAQFLQDNELEVGDTNVNKTVYDGQMYNGSNVYILTTRYISGSQIPNSKIVQRGTHYKYSRSDIINNSGNNITFTFGNKTYSYYVSLFNGRTYYDRTAVNAVGIVNTSSDSSKVDTNNCVSGRIYRGTIWDYNFFNGYPVIYTDLEYGGYCLGIYYANTDSVDGISREGIKYLTTITINENDVTPVNVVLVSNVINNNTYEGDTIINNEGDVIVEPDPVQPGGNDPGWDIGGGGGTATDGNGNTWNITFPDFELPDLNIDWSINGLGEKFPFSIPFDLVALVTVLNAEPQAPRFEGTVNFGFTTWDYDINLEQFDTVAQACRIAELLLLVVGLILITRSIIKG